MSLGRGTVSLGRGIVSLVDAARELGFARAAIVPIEPPRRHELYTSWLAAGHAGEMTYLAAPDHVAPRADLRALLDTARSLIVVALAHDRTDPVPADRLVRGRIARYARGEDYHLVMRDKLVQLADRLAGELGRPVASRPCVDSAPVLEREWAERAGIGFVAKNTMVIAPGAGSYLVLGELLVDAELAPTAPAAPAKPRCGSCRSCLDACPTGAFVDAYVLDARRCISYLTIEHHAAIPRELRPAIGTWVFGCDVCQEVCPFNAGAGEAPDRLLQPRSLDHALPDLVALAGKGANQLRRFVRRTALRRIPRAVLLRNVAVALGNTGDPAAIAPLVALLGDTAPLVRGHAAWALGRFDDPVARAALEAALVAEAHPDVLDELTAARGTSGSPRSPRSP
jgi:epoxyqueuosine reductase